MPNPANYDNQDDWMAACVPTMMDEGRDQDQAVAACLQMWRDRDKKSFDPAITRAWSKLTIKSVDAEKREIEGVATTPTVDRIGDIVEPMGAKFTLPIPLLHHHKHDQPVGQVISARPTKDGISIRAKLARIAEPGPLKDRVETAWQEIKAGLIRGLSIGFKPIEYEPLDPKDPFGGLRFNSYSLYELSLVTIPANADAQITMIKSIDQSLQAANGQAEASGSRTIVTTIGGGGGSGGAAQGRRDGSTRGTPGLKATSVNLRLEERRMSKTFSEQVIDLEHARAAKEAAMAEIMQKAVDESRSTDENERDNFDDLQREVEAIDGDLKRLRVLERQMLVKAQPVQANTIADGAAARAPQIRVQAQQMPPGVRMARVAKCLAMAEGSRPEALRIGKTFYASDLPTIATLEAAANYGAVSDMAIKAAVPAGSTVDTQWAGALVSAAAGEAGVVGDFLEYLRPQTIIGKFGTGNVPNLRRVPFRTGLVTQHNEGSGFWVGEGAPKPVTKIDLSRRTLLPTKVANIAVVTEELMRDSSPSADIIVRDSLVNALRTRLDSDFIDPAITASGARPASITNGVTAQTSFSAGGSLGGGTALSIRRDINRAVDAFIDANLQTDSLVWIMRANTAMKLSMIVNSLGEPDALFANVGPAGGTLAGIPVVTSQFVPATASPTGDYVVLMDAQNIWFADEGGFNLAFSREASIAMEDAPTGAAFTGSPGSVTGLSTGSLVSLFQEDLVGWRAERTVNWLRARSNAVVVIESVNWGEA